jgi:glycine/D-amino acid oxidase-like deaminating enzyme
MQKKCIIVLGGGIMGMSAAYQLLSLKDQPYSVTIISEFFSPSTLSDKSGKHSILSNNNFK